MSDVVPDRPTPMLQFGPIRLGFRGLLLLVLVLAAALRFTGLEWDDGYYLHPDERFMVMVTVDTAWPASVGQYFDSAVSPLNPYNTQHGTFVYGTFPVFLTRAINTLLDRDVYGEAHLAGRFLSALADVGTVALAAWIARRFFGRWAGILAGFLLACTMLHIQSAHFYTVDSMSVFFATATFAASLQAWRRQSFFWFAVAGLMTGLAGASKPNYLIAAAFLALPALEMVRLSGWRSLVPRLRAEDDEESFFPVVPATALAMLVAFWTFRIAQPYAFAGPSIWNIMPDQRWLDDLRYWRTAQQGFIDVKSSVQWVGRTPVLYILDNMVRWGMGPPLALASLAGLVVAGVGLLRSRWWPSWWMIAITGWSAAQLLLYGLNIAQAQRYLLPVYPFLVVLASGLLVRLSGWRPAWALPRWARPGTLLIAITVGYTLFYAVAFTSLYVRPLSRVQASEWIYEHVPPGSAITSEYWDDALPMRLEGEDPWQYTSIQLDLYAFEGPDSTKLSKLIGQLNRADYIILSSNRVIESVPRQPERYPMANHYYEMLLSGELGFDLVADFKQTPELFGIALDDSGAEETLTVYEHPYVRIFKKSDRFDAHQVWYALNGALGYGGVTYLPGDPTGDQMLMSPEDRRDYAERGTWSALFDPGNLTNRHPALWWYLAMQALALPAIPLAWRLARHLPDRGYALTKPLGLLGVTWIAWMLASVRLLQFGPLAIGVGWALMLVAGALVVWRRRTNLLSDLRAGWRWIVAAELLFGAAFAAMAWVRSLNPDVWRLSGSGEAPFFLATFNALARSAYMPPYDPWLSGGFLHTPYWGQVPWVAIAKLTGILPATAYTLAFAGIFALLCLIAWSAAAALIARLTARPGRWVALLALSAPVLVGVLGTLLVARRIAAGAWGYAPRPDSWPGLLGLGDVIYGMWTLITGRLSPPPAFHIEAMDLSPLLRAEIPFASFLGNELGPAVSALPLIATATLVAIALATRTCVSPSHQWRLERDDLALMALGGAFAGLVMASTTWGFLPAIAVVLAAMLIRVGTAHGWCDAWPVVRGAAVSAALIVVVAVAAVWPFLRGYRANGRDLPLAPTLGLGDFLTLNGLLLVVLLSYLALQGWRVVGEAWAEGWGGRLVTGLTAAIVLAALGLALLSGSTTLFVLVALLLVMIALWPHQAEPGHLMILALGGVGLLLAIAQNVMALPAGLDGRSPAPQLGLVPRLLLGIAAAAVIAWGADRLGRARPLSRLLGAGWMVVLALLVVATSAYPVLATISYRDDRLAPSARTLDATAFMRESGIVGGNPPRQILLDADREAAQWLMENVDGLPVILEAQTLDGWWGGRISTLTGLPTVLGWNTPERMMRPGWTQLVWTRQDAVRRMLGSMGSFSSITPLLAQYEVRLIYIGPVERAIYDPVALRKFETAADQGLLDVIYRTDEVTIYRFRGVG